MIIIEIKIVCIHIEYKLQVSYEFSLRYPNVDEFAFQNAWKILSERAVNVFESMALNLIARGRKTSINYWFC